MCHKSHFEIHQDHCTYRCSITHSIQTTWPSSSYSYPRLKRHAKIIEFRRELLCGYSNSSFATRLHPWWRLEPASATLPITCWKTTNTCSASSQTIYWLHMPLKTLSPKQSMIFRAALQRPMPLLLRMLKHFGTCHSVAALFATE